MRGRQPDVHDAHVGTLVDEGTQQLRRAGHGRDDLEPVRGEQPDQALPQQEEVFADDDAHGTSMTTMVGPPGGLLTARMPANVASLRSSPARPVPQAAAAPPAPLSVTSARSTPPRWLRSIWTGRASACLTTLASASATLK